MSLPLAWGGTTTAPQLFSTSDSGVIVWTQAKLTADGFTEAIRFAVLGAYISLVFTFTWVPVTLGQKARFIAKNYLAITDEGSSLAAYDGPDVQEWTPGAGDLFFTGYGFPNPGTLTISALINGLPASNVLIIVTGAGNGTGYGSAAWAATTPQTFWTQRVKTVET